MTVTEKIKETADKLRDKLKAQKDKISGALHSEAHHEKSESERIAKDLQNKAKEKAAEVKEHFDKGK